MLFSKGTQPFPGGKWNNPAKPVFLPFRRTPTWQTTREGRLPRPRSHSADEDYNADYLLQNVGLTAQQVRQLRR